MKLTIFAATGGIGRQLLAQAVAAGHEVTAVVRNPKRLSPEIRAIMADLAASDPVAIDSAIEGTDAVLSALGPRSISEAGITSQGTRAIVQAAKALGRGRGGVGRPAPAPAVPRPGGPGPTKHD